MDDSNLAARIKRYAQVSTAVTGLAARLAGEKYLGVAIDRDKHASDLTDILGTLKGPLMKIGQFLATVPGALPAQYAQELLKLQSQAPSMGWNFVRRRMNHELGPTWQDLFCDFDQEASAAASLGQVHRATTKDGIQVACKLQYPDMESAIEADLSQLTLFLNVYEAWNKALQTSDIQQEIKDRLIEELDYRLEADHIRLYQTIFENHSHTAIPTVFPELSTKRLLTMSWMEGESILSLLDEPDFVRNEIASRLFHTWYYPLYHYGVIHGDPHPGNYKFHKPTQTLHLLDFGCVRIFPPKFIYGVIELYHALLHNHQDRAVHAYEVWGFQGLTKEVIDIITQWANLIYAPLLEDRIRPIQDDLEGIAGWETATKVHEALNKAGGIRPPREFVFMDRAAVGIGSVIMRLKAEHNWYRLFNELIENFSVDTLQERQDKLNPFSSFPA